jgi:lipoate-protein ligase A
MPTPIRLLNLGPTRWLRTQSVYHALAETMTEESPDTIILTQSLQPYVCIGYHQELHAVLDRASCARMHLPIVRRRVGGGATYLDVNQLFYQCIFHHSRVPATVSAVYARLLAAPVAALKALGLNAELCGENEIEVGGDAQGRPGKRIAGIGGGRIGEAAVVVGNLLFDFNYNAMTRAWRVPSEPFRRLASEALRDRLTTLWMELPHAVSPDEVQALLITEFARALNRPIERGELTSAEMQKVEELNKRLVSYQWLSLHSDGAKPMTALKISRGVFIRAAEAEVTGLHVRAALRAHDDEIVQAILESEPARDWGEAEARLRGMKVRDWMRAIV